MKAKKKKEEQQDKLPNPDFESMKVKLGQLELQFEQQAEVLGDKVTVIEGVNMLVEQKANSSDIFKVLDEMQKTI